VAKFSSKGVKKSFGLFAKKKKEKGSLGDDNTMDESETATSLDMPSTPISMEALAALEKSVGAAGAAATPGEDHSKRRSVELRRLTAVENRHDKLLGRALVAWRESQSTHRLIWWSRSLCR
jgi:hypothetical protein